MLLNQEAQTQNELFSTVKHDPRLRDDLIWHKEREAARYKKIQDQKQTREMLERYYPWGSCQYEAKPRGLRNLRLEGLFPHQDFEKAKRSVLGMGRPGGGAPNVNEHGSRICRTREDPLLRFQWGKDLRRCVDNTLRYRMNKDEQAQYKRELDKLVAEKFKQKEKERMDELVKDQQLWVSPSPWGKRGPGGLQWRHPHTIGRNFIYSLGYTNSKLSNTKNLGVLDRIDRDTKAHTKRIRYNDFKNSTVLRPPNQLTKTYKTLYGNPANVKTVVPLCTSQQSQPQTLVNNVNVVNPFTTTSTSAKAIENQLTSLRNEGKDTGIELVPLMVEKRRANPSNHLRTTDVTKNGYTSGAPKWVVDGQIYLRELSKQMNAKLSELKDLRRQELESTRKHFNTLDNFWGRPGHGAPRSALKKASIDKLLYGARMPVAVA